MGWRIEDDLDAGVEQALARAAERAFRCGARAGLEALVQEAQRLTGASGAAFHDGRVYVARTGLGALPRASPGPSRRPVLVVWPELPTAREVRVLARMSAFGAALLAARAREQDAAARQVQLLKTQQRLTRRLTHQEHQRSRASHDLRTPLMVIKGYVDMMLKGTTGGLTAPIQRYLERLRRSADDQSAIIERRLAKVRHEGVEDLRPLLRTAFIPSARGHRAVDTTMTLPDRPVAVPGPRDDVELLVRTLARAVASSGAPAAVRVESAGDAGVWQLRVTLRSGKALPEKSLTLLRHLTQRLRGGLSLPEETGNGWVVHLPVDDTVPVAPRDA
ncbi:sensor histidine kinase [Corallococcus macrosporus]|uniref:histidine kinase n=1 Tax=Corallococcus macrosporus DSM 14697 TaxID=1189310 RepID=A0A250JTL6_9BACT|nr:histidine kinase dimerization/phospho-acceptor domain-containing protein [Corallococcus macrosporus]ATB47043.1 histidine kinase [Corallococcus macrosporus DSM 14697]